MTSLRFFSSFKPVALAAVVVAVALAGCASKVPLDNKGADVVDRSSGAAGSASSGSGASTVAPVDLTANQGKMGSSVVYFDFDSFVVRDEYRPVIDTYSKQLLNTRQKRVTIEGHTDERGGREYNLALGQKRAESVAKSMKLLGANDTQIESVSFGKERPVASGSDEDAWAKNRRAEIKAK